MGSVDEVSVSVCVCVCVPGDLSMIRKEIHHNGIILCGVVYGSGLGLSRVVETRVPASKQKGYQGQIEGGFS